MIKKSGLSRVTASPAAEIKDSAVAQMNQVVASWTDVPVGLVMVLATLGSHAWIRWTIVRVARAAGHRRPRKIANCLSEAAEYAVAAVAGLALVWDAQWFWTQRWFDSIDALDRGRPAHQWMSTQVAVFYVWYAARYLAAVVRVVWLEPRRHDHWQMLAHHWLTLAAVVASYVGGLTRIGLVVMVLFDPGDVPLQLAKACKACQWSRTADALFAVFAIVFVATRLVAFPAVCWSAHVDLHHTPTTLVCCLALDLLFAINLAWAGMIVQVAGRVAGGEPASDDRSDSDEATSQ